MLTSIWKRPNRVNPYASKKHKVNKEMPSKNLRFGAVISAAGMSSRMKEWKPLLTLGQNTMIEQVICRFLEADFTNIMIVTGYRAAELEAALSSYPLQFVHNKDYETTDMLTSLKIGLRALYQKVDYICICPCDSPLFSSAVLSRLMEAAIEEEDVICPTFQGRPGHPVCLNARFIPDICTYEGEGGLQGFFTKHQLRMKNIVTEEEGVVLDADTPEAFKKMLLFYQKHQKLYTGQ